MSTAGTRSGTAPEPQPHAAVFSQTYAQARDRFLTAAHARGAALSQHPVDARGIQGEALCTDVALLAQDDARSLLVMTSATHGVEGYCGSACQVAALHDDALLAQLRAARVGLLLVHAINPYGFSWSSRTNEDNIDLNRNAQAFDRPLPDNAAYPALHAHLVPSQWPPAAQDRAAIDAYIAEHGFAAYQHAVSRGQYTHADGVFFGGTARSRSLKNLHAALAAHGQHFGRIGWIDVHTGLGPWGHGEKIYAGRRDDAELARARAWWGADIAVPYAGKSASADITGQLASLIYDACPHASTTSIALEFGTVPIDAMFKSVRGEAWLRSHPDASPEQADAIRQQMRDAFLSDDPHWQGMVLGQSRVAVVQAAHGLAA